MKLNEKSEVRNMKNGTHVNLNTIDEISAMRILRELREKSLKENDGKVHVRDIENGHVGRTIKKF